MPDAFVPWLTEFESSPLILEQVGELVRGQVRVANDGPQKRLLNGPAGMDWNYGSRFRRGMNQDQVASSLPVLHKPGAFECSDHLPRSHRWELCHGQAGTETGTLTLP